MAADDIDDLGDLRYKYNYPALAYKPKRHKTCLLRSRNSLHPGDTNCASTIKALPGQATLTMVRAVKSVAGIRVDPEKAWVAGTWSSGASERGYAASDSDHI